MRIANFVMDQNKDVKKVPNVEDIQEFKQFYQDAVGMVDYGEESSKGESEEEEEEEKIGDEEERKWKKLKLAPCDDVRVVILDPTTFPPSKSLDLHTLLCETQTVSVGFFS